MGSLRVLLPAATTLSLAVAGPAAALSGAGISGPLHSRHAVTIAVDFTVTGKASTAKTTCQAQTKDRTANPKPSVSRSLKKFPVVACEQPPRSQLVTPAMLKQATTSALASIG
jgi:hypothetical protein